MPTALFAMTALCAAFLPQDPGSSSDDLDAILAAERQRIDVMAAVAPAVCSVMSLTAPGGGSGVVIDPAGFVLTNFHVVGDPTVTRMKIGLPDGHLHGAMVLGVDPGSDLAVLLLDPPHDGRPWPFAPLGDSDDLLVGEQVFAMGNPFLLATDFEPTTTWGIVSGTHRYQPGQGNRALVYPDCIQVDVPINPGNSGGPLFSMNGKVVGINGRISIQDQRGRVNVGVGFAIAANQIRNFLPDLMAGRFAEHGTLDMNAWFMDTGDRRGVFVQSVFADSRVTEFGMALGDQLLSFNGAEIRSANQLATLVGVLPANTWVSLTFRPLGQSGALGDARTIEFALRRLDTGSSKAEDRIASEAHRRAALEALARKVGSGDPVDGASIRFDGPDGATVVVQRLGTMLRIDDASGALVRRSADDGFHRSVEGSVRDLTAEERAKLERVLTANPFLWSGPALRELIREGVLEGGVMVGTTAGFRVALPGDGEREVWFGLDGSPAGCRYRDPLQKAVIELHRDVHGARIVKDGHLSGDWRMQAPDFTTPGTSLFERPAQ